MKFVWTKIIFKRVISYQRLGTNTSQNPKHTPESTNINPKTCPDSKTHVTPTGRGFVLLIEGSFKNCWYQYYFLVSLCHICFGSIQGLSSLTHRRFSFFFLWNWYLLRRTLKYLICMAHKELLVTWCNIYWHNDGMAWVHNTWSILGPQCL